MDLRKTALALSLTIAAASANAVPSLGTILDGSFFDSAVYDTVNDTTDKAYVTPTAGNSGAALLFEAGPNTNSIFGIFTTDQFGSIIGELEVFSGGQDAPSDADVNFSGTTIDLQGGGSINAGVHGQFGFFIENENEDRFYSDSSLNPGNIDYAGLFDISPVIDGTILSDVVIAFDDGLGGTPFDYNDLVVGISNVTPVPVPAAALLFGAGISVLGLARRRKTKEEVENNTDMLPA